MSLTCLLCLGGLIFLPAGAGHLARNPGARHAPRRSFRLRRSGALAGSSCKCQLTEGHLQAARALTQSCHVTLATAVTRSMLQAHSAAAPQTRSGFLGTTTELQAVHGATTYLADRVRPDVNVLGSWLGGKEATTLDWGWRWQHGHPPLCCRASLRAVSAPLRVCPSKSRPLHTTCHQAWVLQLARMVELPSWAFLWPCAQPSQTAPPHFRACTSCRLTCQKSGKDVLTHSGDCSWARDTGLVG